MLKIEVQTPDALADADRAGVPLATILRAIANRIEAEVSITPTTGQGDEWKTETYRHAQRVTFTNAEDDTTTSTALIGAVWTLEAEAPVTLETLAAEVGITVAAARVRCADAYFPLGHVSADSRLSPRDVTMIRAALRP